MNFEEKEKRRMSIQDALIVQFMRSMTRSPFFVPLVLMIFGLFIIGFLHTTGITPIYKLFDLSSPQDELIENLAVLRKP